VWGGYSGSFTAQVIPPHGVAYDPAANRWPALPMSPLHGRTAPTAVWTGSQMIVWGGSINNGQTQTDFKDGAAYRPAAT
jgi:hypothetical protein